MQSGKKASENGVPAGRSSVHRAGRLRPRVTYTVRKDGEGWDVKDGEIFKLECCDCGLVHRIVLVTGNPGELIGIAAARDNRATAQRRRQKPTDRDDRRLPGHTAQPQNQPPTG